MTCGASHTYKMNNTYYSKTEDGNFHPITLNQTLASDILGEIFSAEIRSALSEKVMDILADFNLSGKVQSAVDAFDISKEVEAEIDSALRSINVEDMVRDEVQSKVENMDIDVSVSI